MPVSSFMVPSGTTSAMRAREILIRLSFLLCSKGDMVTTSHDTAALALTSYYVAEC